MGATRFGDPVDCDRRRRGPPVPGDVRRDRGQAVLMMLAVIVCCALVAVAIGVVGVALRERQQARTGADAAALAGVEGGRGAAARLAAANGGALVSFTRSATPGGGWIVDVIVRVGAASAAARATNGP